MLNAKLNSQATGYAVVIGLGRNGMACATFLQNTGWDVEATDFRHHPSLESVFRSTLPGVCVQTPLEPEMFMNADLVALSSALTGTNARVGDLAKEYGAEILSSFGLFLKHCARPVVAVTGTNGKSTVTSLVEAIMQKHQADVLLGGARGFPIPELLNKRKPDVYLLELSVFHLEQATKMDIDVGAVLNISKEHGEKQIDYEAYRGLMERALNDARTAVINRAFTTADELNRFDNYISFGLDRPPRDQDFGIVEDDGGRWIARGAKRLLNLGECRLRGAKAAVNLLAACAVAEAAGFPVDRFKQVVEQFSGLPYRCVEEGRWNGVRWINDARSNNVDAVIAALEANPGPAVLIAGGISNGADFEEITRRVNGQLKGCVVIGKDQMEISRALRRAPNLVQADSIAEAVRSAERMAEEGDCVIFSPGCASFDMFTDYGHRGESFAQVLKDSFA